MNRGMPSSWAENRAWVQARLLRRCTDRRSLRRTPGGASPRLRLTQTERALSSSVVHLQVRDGAWTSCPPLREADHAVYLRKPARSLRLRNCLRRRSALVWDSGPCKDEVAVPAGESLGFPLEAYAGSEDHCMLRRHGRWCTMSLWICMAMCMLTLPTGTVPRSCLRLQQVKPSLRPASLCWNGRLIVQDSLSCGGQRDLSLLAPGQLGRHLVAFSR